jgi:hypothetical protein
MLRAQLQAGGQTELEAKLTIEAYQARFVWFLMANCNV